jgi:putative transcriptional regulator
MNGSKQAAKGMSADAFGDLMAGMEDVRAFERGKRRGFVVHSGQDIKAIRAKTKLTQPKFAEAFHLDVAAVRDWEQGRRQPERAAQVLLELIDREPETVQRILAG